MTFTTAEKIQLAMLCDMAKPANERQLDYDFIAEAVLNDDVWALAWKYTGWDLKVPTPDDVKLVCDILEMWDRLETSFDDLIPAEKARVEEESYRMGAPRFPGFDGNRETELMHIARVLTRPLERWQKFKDRDLNSHMPTSAEIYERMLAVWRPLWDKKLHQTSGYKFTADEIISVMRERIHPERRKIAPDGGWTLIPVERDK